MKKLTLSLLAAVALGAAQPSLAMDWRPTSFFVLGGVAEHGTTSATVGVAWPWSWKSSLGSAQLSGQTEAYISYWHADSFRGGPSSYTQLGLVPVLRLRFDEGRSPWFVEAGIGISVTDRVYRTPHKQFSTAGQFHDTIGFGYSFGAQRTSELGLRLTHFSNAGIKRPNPGENFLQLRYAHQF
jgi:lipid A 3-O-deacylase